MKAKVFLSLLVGAVLTPAVGTAQEQFIPVLLKTEASGPAKIGGSIFFGNEEVIASFDESLNPTRRTTESHPGVAWLRLTKEYLPAHTRRTSYPSFTDFDPDLNEAVLELEGPVPEQSVWLAINIDTGQLAAGSPEGWETHPIPFPAAILFPGTPNDPDYILDSRQTLRFLLVRMGEGAWSIGTGDGTPRDADGVSDGRITIALDELEPVGDSGPLHPSKFLPQDVVLGLDTRTFEFYAARVIDLMGTGQ